MPLNYRIGNDLVYMPRLEAKLENEKFLEKVLTKNELEIFINLTHSRRKLEFLAGRFGAKEAIAKALGCGIGQDFDFLDVEILKDEKGAPILVGLNGQVSIAHDGDYALVNVLLEVNIDESI